MPGTGSADIRTFVHEYGGGAWIPVPAGLAGGGPATGGPASGGLPAVLGACAADQRLRLFGGGEAGDSTAGGSTAAGNGNAAGRPATPPAPVARGHRYADPAWVPGTDVSVWVREVHDDGAEPPRNEIVSVRLDGTVAVLAAGADFYASPQPSPDGTRLAFLSWDHPNMPWDHTRLHLVELDADVAGVLDRAGDRVLLDGPALQQPRWSPDGRLHVVSDADGYWDIVRV
ncbi:MAG TPA: hypothetical protein DEP69_06230, partial [Acidimicrobiaceae bacterium]|nr:hypothetical protein [Acidimicrobiaceae bacterium]